MWIYLFFLFSFLPTKVFANDGHGTGNGGDSVVQEFKFIADLWKTELTQVDSKLRILNDGQVATLFKSIQDAKVESTFSPLILGGREVEAINYPAEQKIVINLDRWKKNQDLQSRAVFVLHEYLGLAQIDDSSYQISNKLRGAFSYVSSRETLKFEYSKLAQFMQYLANNYKEGKGIELSCFRFGEASRLQKQLLFSSKLLGPVFLERFDKSPKFPSCNIPHIHQELLLYYGDLLTLSFANCKANEKQKTHFEMTQIFQRLANNYKQISYCL